MKLYWGEVRLEVPKTFDGLLTLDHGPLHRLEKDEKQSWVKQVYSYARCYKDQTKPMEALLSPNKTR